MTKNKIFGDGTIYGVPTKELHKYIFKGTIQVEDVTDQDIDTLLNQENYGHNPIDPYIASIKDCLYNYSDENLAFYFDNPKVKIVYIQIQKLEGIYYSFCEIYASEEMSSEELEATRIELRGQYSDGFGEGFEQQDCYEYTDNEEVYNEEEGEYEDEEVKHWIVCHLWQHENFTLELIRNTILDEIANS